jgi:hypothetical protein
MVWRVAALAAILVGLGSTWTTLRSTPKRWRVLERKASDLGALRSLQGGGGDPRAARATLASLPVAEPSFVQNVAGQLLGDMEVNIQEAEPEPLGDGWLRRMVDVSIARASLERVMHLITALEDERPPWRLRSCAIEGDETQRGWGRVVLKFEALHRESL